jgi:hypothetical protein
MNATGTYVYCLIADTRRPSLARRPASLSGLGRVRLLDVEAFGTPPSRGKSAAKGKLAMWAVVADAPLTTFSEDAINRGLADLDWVSRAAVAHEAVVESFISAAAVLPMKLFTLFTNDDRALAYIHRERGQIERAIERVKNHDEWGLRVILDRARASSGGVPSRKTSAIGATYLQRKKAQKDAVTELARRAREVVADLYDLLARHASLGRRRVASELPSEGGPLLLDAAFLVPRRRAARFRTVVAREARMLMPQGYALTLSGPWPPYTFMQD